MEYAVNRSLKDAVQSVILGILPSSWSRTGIAIVICGLVLGMRFVHSRNIIHRDLKPSNALLATKGRVLIADFGTSHEEYDDRTPVDVGTAYYAAPEMFEDGAPCTAKCDVFTFGLILYELLTYQPVFDRGEDTPFCIIRRLRTHDVPTIPENWGTVMVDLIPWCWQDNPDERPSFQAIFELFEAAKFEIIPGTNVPEIRGYCEAVLAWEEQNPAR
jgi:serine/threonine protein kinase